MGTESPAREAATILRRVVQLLRLPSGVASYLRGYADALEARRPRRRR
jgi:hypothetical protein